jgi:long-chain acyl-CoA synthetase
MATGGKDRDYVGLLITIDLDNVGNWAESRGLDFTTYADLSQKGPVYELIKAEIQTINSSLPVEAKVKKFTILAKELDPDEAELTRTRKLRRNFIEEKNGAIIDAIYSGRSDYDFDMEILYRDGRKGHVKSNIRIEEL